MLGFDKRRYAKRMLSFQRFYIRHRSHTMIRRVAYVENLVLTSLALDSPEFEGLAIVECGTWKGGMAAGLVGVGGGNRDYWFFDSFEGLPPAREIDGARAMEWQRRTNAKGYYNNCTATLNDFWDAVKRTRIDLSRVHLRKGFFEETLSKFTPPAIAVLRLDGDWYDSTMICLRAFWDSVVPGGLILIDDYGTWDGCTRAVHDFLSLRKAREYVQQGPLGRVAYIRRSCDGGVHSTEEFSEGRPATVDASPLAE